MRHVSKRLVGLVGRRFEASAPGAPGRWGQLTQCVSPPWMPARSAGSRQRSDRSGLDFGGLFAYANGRPPIVTAGGDRMTEVTSIDG